MIEGTKKIETHCIEWTCGRCRATARLPHLAGATIDDVRDAIVRGHERRSFDCHFAHGIKHVRAVQDGKILRFTATREASMEQNTAGNTGPAKSSSPLSLPDTEYLERAFTYHPPKGDQEAAHARRCRAGRGSARRCITSSCLRRVVICTISVSSTLILSY